MKKLFGALIVGTMVFGAVFASASSLTVNPAGTIQVGVTSLNNCQTDPVSVTWGADFTGTVTFAGVGNLDSACSGQNLYFYALRSDGRIIAAGGTLNAGSGAGPIAFAPYALGGTSLKVYLGAATVTADDSIPNQSAMPYGIDGSLITGVRIVIGA